MWGYPVFVLGAISSFLEPFCGHLSPKLDKLCSKLTFEIPPRRALRGHLVAGQQAPAPHLALEGETFPFQYTLRGVTGC